MLGLITLIFFTAAIFGAVVIVRGNITPKPTANLYWIPIVVFLLGVLMSTVVIVQAGHVGVVTRFGAVTGTNFEQGLHAKTPFIESVAIFDVRVQKDQVDAAAASKDLQEVKSTIAVNYHLDAKEASTVYREVGREYKQRVIDPAVQESFKSTTAQFTAEELITQREAVKTKAREFLKEKLGKFHIIVDEFNIVNFDFSAQFNQAIEQKQVAQQNVEKAKRDLERIKIEAAQKIAEAEGQSRAQQLQQQTLTELYVQFKALEKWDGKLPIVVGGAVPFLNLPSK
jgi:regulator of protease activity HflC (stomatin/prohibitin superfamily)